MKTFYMILVALFTVSGAIAQWTPLPAIPQVNLFSIFFTDANTGYAVGDTGTIFKTNDAGATWMDIPSGKSNSLYSIFFINANTGFVVGDNGTIQKTIDGGTTWTSLSSGTTELLRSVYFTDVNTGYAVGRNEIIIKTIDGGTTWSNISPPGAEGDLYSVAFADASTGYAVGYAQGGSGIILKTTDGGISWGNWNGITGPLFSVYFRDINTCYAVGGNLWYRPPYSEVVKITNGGAEMTTMRSENSACLKSVYFSDANTGYAVGDFGTILKTSDGGMDWIIQNSGVSSNFTSVFFTDANTGYATGDYFQNAGPNTILKTTDGGGYPEAVNNQHPMLTSLKIYPNPSSDKITIETATAPVIIELSIWNLDGQEFITRKITEPRTQLDISALPGGVYGVKIIGERGMQVGKFIKQ
jgi:photosystem II stability/assembly factor-like uncharacterized protein